MDERLTKRLSQLAGRLRAFDLGWQLTAVVGLSALVAWILTQLSGRLIVDGAIRGTWALATITAVVVVAILALRRYRQLPKVAQRVENHFPALNQQLVTACSIPKEEARGYLSGAVVGGVIRHDFAHRWKSVMPWGRLAVAWASLPPALICLAICAAALWNAPRPSALSAADTQPAEIPLPTEVTVVPGSVEVERGSSVVFTVTFPADEPNEVWWMAAPLSEFGATDRSQAKAFWQRQLRKAQASSDLLDDSVRPMNATMNRNEFGTYVSDVDESFVYAIAFDGDFTETFDISVFEYPELVRADARVTQPAYTGAETQEIVDTRRITAAEDSRVEWKLHLNKPVANCWLVPTGTSEDVEVVTPIELSPTTSDPLVWTTELKLTESIKWELKLVDASERENDETVYLRAKVVSNNEPKIELTSQGDAAVSPLEEFAISAKVFDDFGIESAGIAYQFAGGGSTERSVQAPTNDGERPEQSAPMRRQTINELIAFEALNAEPKQLLSYYVWAEDRDKEGAIRRAVSDIFFVEVLPFDEVFRQGQAPTEQQQQQSQQEGQQQGNQQTQELLELQKEIISATWNVLRQAKGDVLLGRTAPDIVTIADSQAAAKDQLQEKAVEAREPAIVEQIGLASTQMDSAVQSLKEAQQSLAKSDLEAAFAIEQAIYQSLLKMQENESEISRSRQSQSSSQRSASQNRRQSQIDQLRLDNQENRYQEERLAQEEQQEEDSLARQTISRLRELAERQADINEQLRDIEAALQLADAQEREELEEQLKRLREQQQEMLDDVDELNETLSQQQSETAAEAQEDLEQVREQIEQSSEALRQQDTSTALSKGTRAEQKLDELEDSVREELAGQFAEAVQEMRESAQQLAERQSEIVEQLDVGEEQESGGLRTGNDSRESRDALQEQAEKLNTLLEDIKTTVEQAEESEPLLAQKLYDTYRKTRQSGVDEQLEYSASLLEQSAKREAEQVARVAEEGLQELQEAIEDAAESVLGSEVESLRKAADMLRSASEQLDAEMRAAGEGQETLNNPTASPESSQQPPGGNPQPSEQQTRGEAGGESRENDDSADPSSERRQQTQPAETQQNDAQPAESQQPETGKPGDQPGATSDQQNLDASQQSENQQSEGQQGGRTGEQSESEQSESQRPASGQPGSQSQQQPGQPQSDQPSSQQSGEQSGGQQAGQEESGRQQSSGGEGGQQRQNSQLGGMGGWIDQERLTQLLPTDGPITGEEFRNWSDNLREVEELVGSSQLRWEITQLRQRARELRNDYKRHSREPKWSEVEDMVAGPLRTLARKVSDELLRRVAEKTAVVPVDRDPVPPQFEKSVQQYYENLGGRE